LFHIGTPVLCVAITDYENNVVKCLDNYILQCHLCRKLKQGGTMYKKDVLKHFGEPGSGAATRCAEFLGIHRNAVNKWDEIIPRGAAFELEVRTGGVLWVKQTLYPKMRGLPNWRAKKGRKK
jgi:hypothetical protein